MMIFRGAKTQLWSAKAVAQASACAGLVLAQPKNPQAEAYAT
jgi:hypothetical protein